MQQFISLVDSYGLLVVVVGLISSILCGCVKIPIANRIKATAKAKNLGEKAVSGRISFVCTLLVAVFSAVIITVCFCVLAGSLAPIFTAELWSKILLSISFAKIAYMIYEGVGVISLKKAIHSLILYIKQKAELKDSATVSDYATALQKIMTETLHMPLTEHQMETLKKSLNDLKLPTDSEE